MGEQLICGETEIKGGEYEWICVKPPHDVKRLVNGHNMPPIDVDNHYFMAFKKVAEETVI